MESLLFWSKTFLATVGDKPRDTEFLSSQTAARHRAPVPGRRTLCDSRFPAAPSPAPRQPPLPLLGAGGSSGSVRTRRRLRGGGGKRSPAVVYRGGERRGRSRRGAERSRAARPGWRRLLALRAEDAARGLAAGAARCAAAGLAAAGGRPRRRG